MCELAISLEAWEPSDLQWRCARAIAAGHTQQRAADLNGVPLRTLGHWLATTPIRQLISQMRDEIRDTQEPQFQRSIDLSQQIILRALGGEFPADDPRVLLAERILARTLHRIIAMEARGSGRNVPSEPRGLPYPSDA